MVNKILMVCLGNTCRSPIAEAVMINAIKKAGAYNDWHVDSAGIADWHVGKPPNSRSLDIMAKYNLKYNSVSRQITPADFEEFDYIFGMDYYNMDELQRTAPAGCKAKLLMLGHYGLPDSEHIIEDPYGSRNFADFEKIYQQCTIACEAFLKMALENKI